MIIYYSMIIWIILVAIFANFRKSEYDLQEDGQIPMSYAIITFAYIIFWAGIRSGVADTAEYIRSFNAIPSSIADWENIKLSAKAPGFTWLQVFFKTFISENYHWFFMIIAIVQGVSVMKTFRRYSEEFFFSSLLFVLSLNFTWMLNGIRQFIPVTILFGCLPWLVEKKWLPFHLVVLFLSTIHFTALIMIPIYWIVTSPAWSKQVLISSAILVIFTLFSGAFTDLLEGVLSNTAYKGSTDQFANDDGVHPLRVIVAAIPAFLAFICRNQIEDDPNKGLLDILTNMSAICASLYLVGMVTSGILIGRLPIYCELYGYILLPYLFNHYFPELERRILYLVSLVGYGMWFYLQSEGLYYVSEITGLKL